MSSSLTLPVGASYKTSVQHKDPGHTHQHNVCIFLCHFITSIALWTTPIIRIYIIIGIFLAPRTPFLTPGSYQSVLHLSNFVILTILYKLAFSFDRFSLLTWFSNLKKQTFWLFCLALVLEQRIELGKRIQHLILVLFVICCLILVQ